MTNWREPGGAATRIHDFVDRYTVWMKEVAAAARQETAVAASLTDLMKSRLAAELDDFIEQELRLRAFERRAPEQHILFKRVGNDG